MQQDAPYSFKLLWLHLYTCRVLCLPNELHAAAAFWSCRKVIEKLTCLLLRFPQASRVLKRRLQLAHFKTNHGWQHDSIDQLEPKIEQRNAELSKKRRAAQAEVVSSSSTLNPNGKRQALSRRSTDDAINGSGEGAGSMLPQATQVPHQQPSLYDTLLQPTFSSLYAPTMSPGDNSFQSAYYPGSSSHQPILASPPYHRTKTPLSAAQAEQMVHPSSPVSSARDESPNPYSRPNSAMSPHRRPGSLPAISTVHAQAMAQHQQQRGYLSPKPPSALQDQPHYGPAPPGYIKVGSQLKPISSHDPNFAGQAKEFLQAASVLTDLTASEQPEGIPAPSLPVEGPTLTAPSTPKSTSTPVFSRPKTADNSQGTAAAGGKEGGGKKGNAGEEEAELMLFLAGSPSPATKSKKPSGPPRDPLTGESIKGRQLFADAEASDGGGSTGSGVFSDLVRHPSDDGSSSSAVARPDSASLAFQQQAQSSQPLSAPPAISSFSGLGPSPLALSGGAGRGGLSGPAPITPSAASASGPNFDLGSFFNAPAPPQSAPAQSSLAH